MTAHHLGVPWVVFDSWAERPELRGVADRNIAIRPADGKREQIAVVGRCTAKDTVNQERALVHAAHIVEVHNASLKA